jgi:hypothetical protein
MARKNRSVFMHDFAWTDERSTPAALRRARERRLSSRDKAVRALLSVVGTLLLAAAAGGVAAASAVFVTRWMQSPSDSLAVRAWHAKAGAVGGAALTSICSGRARWLRSKLCLQAAEEYACVGRR